MKLSLLPVCLLLFARVAQAESPPDATLQPTKDCATLRRDGRFAVHFPEVPLHDLVQTVADITCRSFILPGAIQGKVSIIGPEKGRERVTAEQFYAAFLSALDAQGLTVTGREPYLRIVEKAKARQTNLPTTVDVEEPYSTNDEMVTRLLEVKNVDPEPLRQLFSQLVSDAGSVLVFPPSTLLINDLGGNLHRLERILAALDAPRPVTEQMRIFSVQHAGATELVERLERFLEGKGTKPGEAPRGAGVQLLADERTNKILALGSPAAFARIEAFLAELDVAVPGNEQVNVYALKNGDAKEIAANLEALVSGAKGKAQAPAGARGDGPVFSGEIKITANESKNALLIVASPGDFRSLSRVIEELDTPLRQVLIETVIMEVAVDRDSELGLSAHGVAAAGAGESRMPLVLGFQPEGLGATSLSVQSLAAASGMVAGLQGPLQRELAKVLGIASLSQFGIVLRALQSNSDVNVLSMPHILTTDNKEAQINVGEKVPFQTGVPTSALASLLQSGNAATAGAITALAPQVTRERVELKLSVKPHIGDGDLVRLEIDQQAEEVSGENALGPITSTRGEKTTVVAHDEETLMLGGIMQDRKFEFVSKVPVLGDIPILGHLFRYKKTRTKKTNLLVFLTPHIIRTPADAARLSERKLKERAQLIRQYYGQVDALPDVLTQPSRRGPLTSLFRRTEEELRRFENGGAGLPGERFIRPSAGP